MCRRRRQALLPRWFVSRSHGRLARTWLRCLAAGSCGVYPKPLAELQPQRIVLELYRRFKLLVPGRRINNQLLLAAGGPVLPPHIMLTTKNIICPPLQYPAWIKHNGWIKFVRKNEKRKGGECITNGSFKK
jgi:hypothetical protein